jgi:hypothetical protein
MAFLVCEPEDQPESMAEPVTRHALNPLGDIYKFLLCGIDSLDLGLYIRWCCDWEKFIAHFDNAKEQAQLNNGHLDETVEGRSFIHLPSAKPPNYRYHVQMPEYHLFIGIAQEPSHSPNGYLSINSEALWKLGIPEVLRLVQEDLSGFGALIEKVQPSRCDLCADFMLPEALTEEFIKTHRVSRSRDAACHTNSGALETYYVGSPRSPVRLRIYDKGKEIVKKDKLWFMPLWGVEELVNIWRVEYQLRRPVLKQFRVYDLENLRVSSFSMWLYLTQSWFSLRLPDDEKQERRTIHPWWELVRDCGQNFGPMVEACRSFESETSADAGWYISHIAGCLPSFAARSGDKSLDDALNSLKSKVSTYWANKDFIEELQRRSIKLGMTGGANEKEE